MRVNKTLKLGDMGIRDSIIKQINHTRYFFSFIFNDSAINGFDKAVAEK